MDNSAMLFCSKKRNILSSAFVPKNGNAWKSGSSYYRNMASQPQHDWFLSAWLTALHVKQARLEEVTGWGKRKTSELVTGKQRYNRDILNEAATVLNLRPFELLLHPDDAMAIRRLREEAARIVADTSGSYIDPPQAKETAA